MEKHWKVSDEEFEKQFSTCKFSPLWFTYQAYLRLTWIHTTKYGREIAFEQKSFQLQEFANKYYKYIIQVLFLLQQKQKKTILQPDFDLTPF